MTPGDYAIRSRPATGVSQSEGKDREMGYVPVRVDSEDIHGLVVATSKPATIAGRIVIEGGALEQEHSKLSVMSAPDEMSPHGRMVSGKQTQRRSATTCRRAGRSVWSLTVDGHGAAARLDRQVRQIPGDDVT